MLLWWLVVNIIYVGNIWKGYGGTEETVRYLLREMAARGHTCHVVHWRMNISRTNTRDEHESGIRTHYVDDERAACDTAMRLARPSDSVIYTALFNRPELWSMAKKNNIRVVHEYNMPRENLIDANNVTFVFNSYYTKSWYPHIEGVVIHPVIDFSNFNIRRTLTDEIRIGLVNPCRVKGSGILKKLCSRNPDYKFITAGGWAHATKHKNRRLSAPATDNHKYMGHLKNMSDFYNNIDILLFPTQDGHDESFGRVVIEAMYHCCCVIASHKDGIPEAVSDGGILVGDYENERAWSEAIKTVLRYKDAYSDMAFNRSTEYVKEVGESMDLWESIFGG